VPKGHQHRRMKMTGLTALNFNDFDKLFVGFDRLNKELTRRNEASPLSNYPRYNLVSVGDSGYRIEMALPGWSKDNIDIKQHKNKLTIEGKEKQELDAKEAFIHKGLSGKTFSRIFTLGDWVEVSDAGFKNGMLVINLQVNTPEENKPKNITIG
jgi:molecular chaperone IbpA